MEQAAFIRAILDEPEDETLRLVFADWLEEHGQDARADWTRASCKLAGVPSADPNWRDLVRREHEGFERCRPTWWQELTGVLQHNDRGMFRFEVRSKTAAARLGKAGWLGDAVADGWLEMVVIGWSDDSLARVVAGWKGAAKDVPLFVCPAPQIGDEGLRFYLEVPHLWGLDLPSHATRNPSGTKLGERSDLRELKLHGLPERAVIAPFFEQIGRLTGLRRLTIRAYSSPNDQDLMPLGELSGLRELHLDQCGAVTDAGLTMLIGCLKGLRRLKLWGCKRVSDAAVTELRKAFPALQIERL